MIRRSADQQPPAKELVYAGRNKTVYRRGEHTAAIIDSQTGQIVNL
jgi:hypothetical protein